MSHTGSSQTRIHVPSQEQAARAADADSNVRRSVGSSDSEPTVISKSPPISPSSKPTLTFEMGRQLEGQQLGHFELREFVGGGGMGSVFRSLDTMLNRVVAVKVLAPDQSHDEDTLRRFKNEAQSAARLDHENIGRVYYVGEDRGLHYIVFEFIEGVNLRDLVEQQGPLSLADAVNYTLQIADALDHASKREVIHRDIKPSNVVITPDGRAKLVDMGLARLHHVDHSRDDLTASGVTLGTFDYISPEQARDPRNADVRSDIYSLGCTFYFMLTGRPPFPEGTVLQKLLQHQGDEPPDPREYRPEIPDDVARIMRKMLAKSPERRYQRPSLLISDIILVASDLGLRSRTAGGMVWGMPTELLPSPWQRHLPWVAPTVALVVIVLVLHFTWTPRGTSTFEEQLNARRSAATRPLPEPPQREKKPAARAVTERASTGLPAATAVTSQRKSTAGSSDPANDEQERFMSGLNTLLASGSKVRDAGDAVAGAIASVKSWLDEADAARIASSLPANVRSSPDAAQKLGELIVSKTSQGEKTFSSLKAACAAAKNGDVIVLQFDGVLEERPIALTNQKLKIRAQTGYRPIVLFTPNDSDPTKFSRSMITVSGGQLTLINVPLVLDIPPDSPAELWTLIEARQADLIRLDSCSLTIRNGSNSYAPYGENAAFFQVKTSPDSESIMTPSAPPVPVNLQLQNSVARGEAAFLHVLQGQPLELIWENGLLTTPEHFLIATGAPVLGRPPSKIRIDLKHVTASTQSGFALLSSEDSAQRLTIEFVLADSILRSEASSPLIEQVGAQTSEDLQKQVTWDGDRIFYEGYSIFWKITAESGRNEPLLFDFDLWKNFWTESNEKLPKRGMVTWAQLPGPGVPYHVQTPLDFALSGIPGDGSARSAGSDGMDAGVLTVDLPTVPIEWSPQAKPVTQLPAATTSSSTTSPATSEPTAGTMRTMGTMKVMNEDVSPTGSEAVPAPTSAGSGGSPQGNAGSQQ